jgi:hypothetical protein
MQLSIEYEEEDVVLLTPSPECVITNGHIVSENDGWIFPTDFSCAQNVKVEGMALEFSPLCSSQPIRVARKFKIECKEYEKPKNGIL